MSISETLWKQTLRAVGVGRILNDEAILVDSSAAVCSQRHVSVLFRHLSIFVGMTLKEGIMWKPSYCCLCFLR